MVQNIQLELLVVIVRQKVDYEFDLENFKNGYQYFDAEKSEFEFSDVGTFFVMLPKSE